MTSQMLMNLLFGALTGLALGLTGAGGGILAIPLLTVGAGFSHAQAAPIALLAVAMAASLGAVMGLRSGMVRYRAALLIGGTGMLVAPAGVWLAQRASSTALTLGLAVVMTWSAIAMFRRSWPSVEAQRPSTAALCYWSPQTGRFVWTKTCAVVLTFVGLVTGALSSLLGVGGGFLLVPALSRLSNLRVDAVISTSQAVIALVSAAGAIAAATQRPLPWHAALPFTAAAMGALLIGRHLALKFAPATVQRSFALLSGCIALALIAQAAIASLV